MSCQFPDADQIPVEDIPSVLIQLYAIQGTLAARLMASRNEQKSEPVKDDELIDRFEAAQLMAVNPEWLRNHYRKFPFARRLSFKNIRFSKKGLIAWINKRKG
jgi:hypothetical protein